MGNVCAQIGRACLLCNGGEHHCERDDACLTFPYSSMDFFSAARNLILKEVVYKLVSLQLPPTLLCTYSEPEFGISKPKSGVVRERMKGLEARMFVSVLSNN